MQPIQDSKKSHNELPPPIKSHGRAFPLSAKSSYYGTLLYHQIHGWQDYLLYYLDNYSDKLRVAMSRLRSCPRVTLLRKTFSNIRKLIHAHMHFCEESQLHRLWPPPYDGPYKVIIRSGKVMKILIKGKVETCTLRVRAWNRYSDTT